MRDTELNPKGINCIQTFAKNNYKYFNINDMLDMYYIILVIDFFYLNLKKDGITQ